MQTYSKNVEVYKKTIELDLCNKRILKKGLKKKGFHPDCWQSSDEEAIEAERKQLKKDNQTFIDISDELVEDYQALQYKLRKTQKKATIAENMMANQRVETKLFMEEGNKKIFEKNEEAAQC